MSGRLDRKYTTVSSWATRQSIPIEEWPNLAELAREQNIAEVTVEALALAHVKAKSPAKGEAA